MAVLIDAQTSETLASELAASLKGPAFTAGMKVEGPVTVRFDSPVYRQVSRSRAESQRRREQFEARRQIERAAEEARRRHAEHLTQLLTTLREQADSVSEVELSALFKTFCDADRGELYAALFAADEGRPRTRSIVVGSGKGLLFFAPDALDRPERSLMLPDGVGPVRSVQVQVDAAGAHCLFVGASCGVHELAADGTGDITTYDAGDQTQVRGGVNSVALAGDHVWATHSELGLLRWRRGAEAGVERVLADRTQGAQAVRCVQFHDGDLYLAADHSVLRIRADDPGGDVATLTGSGSLITAICPAADGLYAGNADGQVLHWEPGNDDQPTVLHAGRRRAAESVTIQEYGGIGRLLYTDTSLAVFARVIGDTIVTRYEAGGQTLRRVEAAPDLIVATNEVRDRLICWKPGAPATPCGVVTVGRLTGHSIQDVCLAPCV